MVKYEILSLRSAMFAEYTQRGRMAEKQTKTHIYSEPHTLCTTSMDETKSYCSLKQPTWLFYCGARFGLRH